MRLNQLSIVMHADFHREEVRRRVNFWSLRGEQWVCVTPQQSNSRVAAGADHKWKNSAG